MVADTVPPPAIPQCRMRYDRFLLDEHNRPKELGSEIFFSPYHAVRVSLLIGDRCILTIIDKATGAVMEERFEPLQHWNSLHEFNLALHLYTAMDRAGQRRYVSRDVAAEQVILIALARHHRSTPLEILA